MLAAIRKRAHLDRGVVGISVVGVSAPAFASGVLLLYVLASLDWFPALGRGGLRRPAPTTSTLPAVAIALTAMALVVKLTRAAMIDALGQDYVAFARARGISTARVLSVYALRNALVPVVTAAGLILGYLFTGAVLVEITFALPGMGSAGRSVELKDMPVVQGIAIVVAILIVIVNLLIDLLYLVVDPRIRFGAAE